MKLTLCLHIVLLLSLRATALRADDVAAGTYDGKPAREWSERLQSDDYRVRRRAAYALGQIGPAAAEAMPGLTAAIKDKHLEVRWYAIDTLGRIGPAAKEAAPAIVAAMQNRLNDKYLRRIAAEALGRIGPEARDSAEALRQALESDDLEYRAAAAEALWLIARDESAIAVLVDVLREPRGDGPYVACMALADLLPDAPVPIAPIVAALGHADADVRRAAAQALGRIGLDAIEPVCAAMTSQQQIERSAAIEALGRIADKARQEVFYNPTTDARAFAVAQERLVSVAAPALIAALNDNQDEVRRAAARSLARIGPAAIPALCKALRTGQPTARSGAAEALAYLERYLPPTEELPTELAAFKQAKLVGPLVAAMGDKDPQARAAAIRAFAALSIGDYGKSAAPLLREALKDEDPRIRHYAAKALERLDAGP